MTETTSSYKKKDKKRVDLYSLWTEYKSYWWLFLISVVGCCGLAFLYSLVKLPQYSVQSNVLISEDDGEGTPMSKILSGNLFGGSNSVDDEQLIMSSHTVMMQTVKDLGLNRSFIVKKGLFKKESSFNDQPVDVVYAPEMNDTLTTALLFKIWVDAKEKVKVEVVAKKKTVAKLKDQTFPVKVSTPYGEFTLEKTSFFPAGESFKESAYVTGYPVAAEIIGETVDIYIPNKKANFITLAMEDANIERASAILNKIVECYNKKGVADQQVKGYKTSEFLDKRIDLLSKELAVSEKDIELYKKSNKITDVRADAAYLMERRGTIEGKLLEAETDNEILKITRDFVANPENRYTLIPLSGLDMNGHQNTVASSIQQYNELILERMKIENNARSGNAALKVLNEQIDALRSNITVSLNKAIENSNVALRDLRDQSRKSMDQLGNIPTQEREYYNMKREQGVKEQLFLFLLQQREQTAISIANSMPRGTVIDEAYAYTQPVSMSRKKMLMLGFVLGLMLPVGFLFVKKKIRNRFETKAEVEELVEVPIIGEVCTSKRPGTLVVKGSSSIAELFRLIRVNLQFVMKDTGDKVVLVTSTSSGEGKSFVSVNLAATMAQLDKKVLLVGMDIRKPQLANYLNISTEPGITQYLSSDKYSTAQILQQVNGVKNLDVVVAGPVPPNPAELLADSKVDDFFAEMRKHYDYIVIDSAPVGMVSDTFVLDRVADATIYVCRANYTPLQDLDFINNIYKDGRLKKMALIVNGIATKKGYGYGYGKIDD